MPHFHASYAGKNAVVAIESLALLAGELPPRALGMCLEWAALHRAELLEDWDLLRSSRPARPIAPLQ